MIPGAATISWAITYNIVENKYGNNTSKELNSCTVAACFFWKRLIHICKKPKFNPVIKKIDANKNKMFFMGGNDKFKIPTTLSDIMFSENSGDIRENIWNNNIIKNK